MRNQRREVEEAISAGIILEDTSSLPLPPTVMHLISSQLTLHILTMQAHKVNAIKCRHNATNIPQSQCTKVGAIYPGYPWA